MDIPVHNHSGPRRQKWHGKGKKPSAEALAIVRKFQAETLRPAAPAITPEAAGHKTIVSTRTKQSQD